MGRPSSFNQETADIICLLLAEGESLRKICLANNLPNQSTVHKWVLDFPDFAKQYMRARELQAHCRAEMATDAYRDEDDPAKARLKFDAMRWHAGKLLPKVYGDKIQQEHTGADGAPLMPVLNVKIDRE